jgi:hypothetical protein
MNRQFLYITVASGAAVLTPLSQLASTTLSFLFILEVLHQQVRHPHHHN